MYEIPKIAVSVLLNLDNDEVIPGSIWVTEDLDEEVRSHAPHPPHSFVVHFNNQQTLYGVVFPTLAEETRVSDLLNQKEQFHVLYRQEKKIVFNRASIVYANAN
jgi:hypothetical protein